MSQNADAVQDEITNTLKYCDVPACIVIMRPSIAITDQTRRGMPHACSRRFMRWITLLIMERPVRVEQLAAITCTVGRRLPCPGR